MLMQFRINVFDGFSKVLKYNVTYSYFFVSISTNPILLKE